MKVIVSAFAAGVAVSVGGIVYLSTGFPWLFPIGLFIVCFYGFKLFTGIICYFRKGQWPVGYLVVFLANAVGAYLTGLATAFAKPGLVEKAQGMAQAKLSEGWALVPLAVLCNVCIFVAVDTYKRTAGNPLGLIFATTVFVASGFEHCVANAYYFGVAGEFTAQMALFLVANAACNGLGGILACRVAEMAKGRWDA